MLVLLVLAISVPTLACFYMWWSTRRAHKLTDHLPGWPLVPVIGNSLKFYGANAKIIFEVIKEISAVCEETDSAFRFWFGPQLCIMMSKPDDIKTITNAFVDKPYYYSFGRAWLGDGLVTAPGAIWKRNIKKLANTFSGSIVDGFQDVFNAQARSLVDKMKLKVGEPPFDAMHDLAYCTLETICQTALGMKNISHSIVTTEYYNAFNRTLELMLMRGFNIMTHPDWAYRLTPAYQEFMESVKVLKNVSDTIISKRRKEWPQIKKMKATQEDDGKIKFKAFLDILMELSDTDSSMTDQQIQSEVDTIIVGGQETTASTMFFVLLMLGCHHHVQKKLHEEFKSIFGDSSRPVDKEDLSRMPYCEAVLYETLRLFPPVPTVMRYSDAEIKLDGYTIPKGTACGVNAWGAGRSCRIWGPDAEDFRPERWLEKNLPHPAGFLAFSYGRRSCIGKKYALALLKTVLAHAVREMVINSNADNIDFKFDIMLRPIQGHMMQVQLRQ